MVYMDEAGRKLAKSFLKIETAQHARTSIKLQAAFSGKRISLIGIDFYFTNGAFEMNWCRYFFWKR